MSLHLYAGDDTKAGTAKKIYSTNADAEADGYGVLFRSNARQRTRQYHGTNNYCTFNSCA